MTVKMCENIVADASGNGIQINRVVLSGEIFVDDILRERTVKGLQDKGYQVYF